MAQDYRLLVKELRAKDTGHKLDNIGDVTLVRKFQQARPGKYDDFVVPQGADDTPPSRRPVPRGAMGQAWDFTTGLGAGVMRGGGKLIRDIEATTPQAYRQLPGGDLNLGQGILGASDYVAGTPGLATGQPQREPSMGSKAGSFIGETGFNLLPYIGATKVARAAYAAPTVAKAVMQSGATQGLTSLVRRALEQGAEPPPPPGVEPQRGPLATGVIDTLAGAGSEVVGALGGKYGKFARTMGDAAIGALAAEPGQRGEGALFQGGLRALIGRTPIHVPGAAGAVPPAGGGPATPPAAPPATPPSTPPGGVSPASLLVPPPAAGTAPAAVTPPAATRPSPAVDPNAYTPVEWAFYPEQRPTMASFGVGGAVSNQPAPVTTATPPAVATPQGLMEGFYPQQVKRPMPGRPINVQDFYGTGARPDPNRTVTKPGEGVTELDLPEFQPGGRPLPGPTGPERQPILYDVPEGPPERPPAPPVPPAPVDYGTAFGEAIPAQLPSPRPQPLPLSPGGDFYRAGTAGVMGERSPGMGRPQGPIVGMEAGQVTPTPPALPPPAPRTVRFPWEQQPSGYSAREAASTFEANAPPPPRVEPPPTRIPSTAAESAGVFQQALEEQGRQRVVGRGGLTRGEVESTLSPTQQQEMLDMARQGGGEGAPAHAAFQPEPELVTNEPPLLRGEPREAQSPEEMIISEVDRAPEQRTAEPPTASISSTNPSLDIPPKPTTRPQSRMVDETPAPDVPPVVALPDTGEGQPPVLTPPPPPPDLPPPPPPTRGRGARKGGKPSMALTPEEIAALGGGAAPLVPGKGGRVKKK